MLEFRKLQLRDIDTVRPYFPYSINRICDNTVGGALMWRDYFSVEYAEYNETVVFKAQVKYHNNITAFSMPLGKDIYGCVDQVVRYCRERGIPVAFCTVTDEDIKALSTVFRDYRLFKESDWSDYIYRAEDLVGLSGRKYSGQRNHINYFVRTFEDFSFEVIDGENLEQVREFYALYGAGVNLDSEVFAEEHVKTTEVLENYELYGLSGALLKVNGSVIAFSIGEIINNVLFIHIEKADSQYRGAYQVISHEFAKHFASSAVEFINREEDVGDEGLRISKNSYHPCEIIEKYIFIVV